MANIKKGARAYYADTDYRRDGMNEAYSKIDSMPSIPTPEDSDAGKVVKVNSDGEYELGDDENTIIIPNPEGTPTEDLNTITIGDKTYRVNDVRVSKILGLRFTINNGGLYVTKMPIVSFVNEYGEAAQVPSYTMTCDKPLQYGYLNLNGDAGVKTENLPAIFTIVFNAEFNIEDFANIKLENSGLFPQDIAKNIKLEYSVNGTDWLEIFDNVSIDWTNTIHIYDMSSGEEITTKSPIPEPTVADAGKVLTVDNNGAWELDNVPPELPTVTSADAGKVLTVDNTGAWGVGNVVSNAHTMLISMSNVTFNSDTNKYSGKLTLTVDNVSVYYISKHIFIDYGAIFAIFINTPNVIALRGVGFNTTASSTTRTCITEVLQNCAFFNDLDNKMYKIANITGSSTSTVFEFELVELRV